MNPASPPWPRQTGNHRVDGTLNHRHTVPEHNDHRWTTSPRRATDRLGPVADVHKLSREAFNRLQAEYDDLTTRGRIEIAKKIETARELGDLSENGDYHAAKEEQGKMEGRIAHLSGLVQNAEIVELDMSDDQSVQAGCVVSIRYAGDDDVEKYLLGSIEERRDDLTVMSPGSPLGRALVGAQVDDTVTFEAPSGPLDVTVVAIDF